MEKMKIEKIPTEKAMKILNDGGLEVNTEETELIMEFLYNLTHLILKNYFKTP